MSSALKTCDAILLHPHGKAHSPSSICRFHAHERRVAALVACSIVFAGAVVQDRSDWVRRCSPRPGPYTLLPPYWSDCLSGALAGQVRLTFGTIVRCAGGIVIVGWT